MKRGAQFFSINKVPSTVALNLLSDEALSDQDLDFGIRKFSSFVSHSKPDEPTSTLYGFI